jgi:hypothetical protein
MNKPTRLILFIIVLLLILRGITAYIGSSYSAGGAIILIGCLLPLALILFIAQQNRWLGVMLGGIAWYHTLPIAFINSIELGIIATVVIAGLIFVHIIQTKKFFLSPLCSWQSRTMAVVATIIAIRVIAERPGSIHTGNVGGAKEAFIFLIGGVAFFLPKYLLNICPDPRLTRRVILHVTWGAFLVHLGLRFNENIGWGIRSLFTRPAWLLCAFAIGSAAHLTWGNPMRGTRYRRINLFWIASGITLILAALSPHRSRILFALSMVCCASYLYGHLKRTVGLLFLASILVTGILTASNMQLPAPVSRSLSILFPHRAAQAHVYIKKYKLSDEIGWESPFRATLMRMAYKNIKQHPFIGKGFTFSLQEYWMSHLRRKYMDTQYRLLAATGAYHNSPIQLAVACGVPVALLFCVVYVGVLFPFIRWIKTVKDKDRDTLLLLTGLLLFFIAASGQMLMNGGSQDFYICSMLLGVMHFYCISQTTDITKPASPRDKEI